MDYELLSTLRRHHPAWRLLAADNAPFVIGFLYDCFIRPNVRALSDDEITPKLEDHLYQLRERLGDEAPSRAAREYLHDWASRDPLAHGVVACAWIAFASQLSDTYARGHRR